MKTFTHKDFIEKVIKYEHVKMATKNNITKLEAENLAHIREDETLYVLSLNKSDTVTVDILETALTNANDKTVKERIQQALGEINEVKENIKDFLNDSGNKLDQSVEEAHRTPKRSEKLDENTK